MNHRLNILIPTHNRRVLLQELLQDIFTADPSFFTINIFVIVDGSNDGTCELLQKYGEKIEIVKGNGNYWWTKCVNEGIKSSFKQNPDYFLLLNDDVILPDHFFFQLSKCISDYPEAILQTSAKDILNNKYYDLGSGVSVKNPFKITRFVDDYNVGMQLPEYINTNYLHGRGMIIPYPAISNVGLLDEKNFPQYFSDSDFALRAQKAGYKLIVARDCFIYIHTEKTGRTIYEKEYSLSNFFKRLYKKNSPSNLKYLIKYNYRHCPKIYFIPFTFFNILSVLAGYLKRWRSYKINERKS
jgi:GT2 family glycosyltransferase